MKRRLENNAYFGINEVIIIYVLNYVCILYISSPPPPLHLAEYVNVDIGPLHSNKVRIISLSHMS